MKNSYLLSLFLLISVASYAQNRYVLDLKNDNWNIKPQLFYISDIVDERPDKSSAGQALYDGKIQPATFKNSLSDDLKMLLSTVEKDTSKTPLIISFDKFKINETGTIAHHNASLEFSLKIYRIINDKRYQIYEAKGNPSMEMRGAYPNVHERLIRESLYKVIENFNSWLNANADLPPLARKVVVTFSPVPEDMNNNKRDTILWTSDYRLKWTDFKGKPGDSPFMAQSNCLFTYKADPVINNGILDLKISMYACFDKKYSFVKDGKLNDTLLAHEQLHFDICELNMRLLRNKILNTTLDVMEFDSQIKSLFDKAWNDYQEEQRRYDDETGHGIYMGKQQKWQNEIGSQLKNISFNGVSLQ